MSNKNSMKGEMLISNRQACKAWNRELHDWQDSSDDAQLVWKMSLAAFEQLPIYQPNEEVWKSAQLAAVVCWSLPVWYIGGLIVGDRLSIIAALGIALILWYSIIGVIVASPIEKLSKGKLALIVFDLAIFLGVVLSTSSLTTVKLPLWLAISISTVGVQTVIGAMLLHFWILPNKRTGEQIEVVDAIIAVSPQNVWVEVLEWVNRDLAISDSVRTYLQKKRYSTVSA